MKRIFLLQCLISVALVSCLRDDNGIIIPKGYVSDTISNVCFIYKLNDSLLDDTLKVYVVNNKVPLLLQKWGKGHFEKQFVINKSGEIKELFYMTDTITRYEIKSWYQDNELNKSKVFLEYGDDITKFFKRKKHIERLNKNDSIIQFEISNIVPFEYEVYVDDTLASIKETNIDGVKQCRVFNKFGINDTSGIFLSYSDATWSEKIYFKEQKKMNSVQNFK